jgi:hypothetical protein
MTPATSVSFFRAEFDGFLYAPIGADKNDSPLSVLSALARLNLDPWREAAELSEMPKDLAAARLEKLIGRLPRGRWGEGDLGSIVDRLIALLPRHPSRPIPSEMIYHQDMPASLGRKVLIWITSLFR